MPNNLNENHQKPYIVLIALVLLAIGGLAGWQFAVQTQTVEHSPQPSVARPAPHPGSPSLSENGSESLDGPPRISLAVEQQQIIGLEDVPAERTPFHKTITLSGKVSLNEDRIAHIYPMVEGTVDQVDVGLGQSVKADDLLVVVHSREVGSAKLELYQARLNLEMATVKNNIQEEISKNAEELVQALRERVAIQDIENRFRKKGMGDYRERLLSAYANYLKSHSDVERLEGITDSGAISAKTLVAAQTTRNADLATFQARIEQIEYELKTSLLLSSQTVREAATRVSVASTNLRILGCSEEDIAEIDPDKQRESISDYPIRAPFDGVVISKDAALKEQVRQDKQVLSIADLSKVWITVDVYEQNIPLLGNLANELLTVRNEAWPDKTFNARVFYTGDIMDDRTRTISMRAIAENHEQLLKPGMFVKIEIPQTLVESALQIPKNAVLEHQGISFVFVRLDDQTFERRNIKTSEFTDESWVIFEGLSPGERVVTEGNFVLKSKLLAGLMGEE